MISLNSLAALTPDISRTRPGQGVEATQPIQPVQARAAQESPRPQRTLEAVPPQPVRPLPRGSLLDLRV